MKFSYCNIITYHHVCSYRIEESIFLIFVIRIHNKKEKERKNFK